MRRCLPDSNELNRLTTTEEIRLVKACIKGKPEAQKKLYDIHANDLFKVCLMYASDHDMASDFLQEGFLKIFQNIHKYDRKGALGGWMRRVMVNTCIDAYRSDKWSKKRERFREGSEYEEIRVDFDPNKIYERDDFLSITSQLPEGYKVVMNLYFLEDFSHKDIAEKLGISEGTSKSQLAKGKKYLKEILLKTRSKEEIEVYGGFDKKVV